HLRTGSTVSSVIARFASWMTGPSILSQWAKAGPERRAKAAADAIKILRMLVLLYCNFSEGDFSKPCLAHQAKLCELFDNRRSLKRRLAWMQRPTTGTICGSSWR